MNKYLLFSGDYYYPSGGMEDFVMSFETLDAAKEYVKASHESLMWHHVADRETLKIVWRWIDGE